MNQLRLDPLLGRWVAVTPTPWNPPSRDTAVEVAMPCPYCASGALPPLLAAFPDADAWRVAVVANPEPAFEGDRPFVVENRGPVFTEAPASGRDELVLLSPDHALGWADLGDDQCTLVLEAINERLGVHSATPGLRCSQVIVSSSRETGAPIEHPHAQLIATPFVPRQLVDEQASFASFAGGCLLCTASAAEERAGYRLVEAGRHAVTLAPFWSRTPYEMLVVPRDHRPSLTMASESARQGVALALRDALLALRRLHGDVTYQVVFHDSPFRARAPFHWHLHLVPRLANAPGAELGGGVHMNGVAPEQAAAELRHALGARQKAGHRG